MWEQMRKLQPQKHPPATLRLRGGQAATTETPARNASLAWRASCNCRNTEGDGNTEKPKIHTLGV